VAWKSRPGLRVKFNRVLFRPGAGMKSRIWDHGMGLFSIRGMGLLDSPAFFEWLSGSTLWNLVAFPCCLWSPDVRQLPVMPGERPAKGMQGRLNSKQNLKIHFIRSLNQINYNNPSLTSLSFEPKVIAIAAIMNRSTTSYQGVWLGCIHPTLISQAWVPRLPMVQTWPVGILDSQVFTGFFGVFSLRDAFF